MFSCRFVGRHVATAFLAAGLAVSPAIAQPNIGLFNDLLQRGMEAMGERAPQRSPAPAAPAVTGDREVARIQQRLLDLGFDAGTPDGLMGNKTRQAIAGFQRQNGFTATGTLTANELAALMGEGSGVAVSPYLTMEPASIVALQQALIARGLLSGGADGVVGNATRRAVAAFQTSLGEEATGELTESQLQVLLAAPSTAVAAPAQQAEPAIPAVAENLDALPRYDHAGNPVRSARPFARKLALATLQLFPSLLDSPAAIKRWFDAEHPFNTSTPSALRGAYEQANAIERDRLLATFRDGLLEEARGIAVPSASAPWRLAIITRVNATGYRPGEGITLNASSAYHLESKIVRLASDYLGVGLLGILPAMPDAALVPTSGDDESSRLLDRIAAEQAVVVTRLAISRIGADAGLGDVFVSDGHNIGLTVTLEGASLNTVAAVADYNPVPGDVLKTLSGSTPVAAQGGGADALSAAKAAGLAVVDGHVVLTLNTFYDVSEALAPGVDYKKAQQRFFDLAGYLAAPLTRFTDDDLQYLAFNILSPAQVARVFGDQYSYDFDDEFERRAGTDVLQRQVMPELLAREAPKLPIPVVAVHELRLGDYNFDEQVFPLHSSHVDPSISEHKGRFGPSRFDGRYLQLPTSFAMPEAAARQLTADRERFYRRIYLASFGTLRLVPERGDTPAHLGLEASRVVLFADQRLTRPIIEYAAADFVPPAETLPAPLSEAELRALAYDWMRADAGTMPTQLAMAAEALSGTAGLADTVIDSSRTVREVTEFSRGEARAQVRAQLVQQAIAPDGAVTFPGRIELGEYDAAAGAFPIRALSARTAANLDKEAYTVDFDIELANAASIRTLVVPADIAERIVSQGGRAFDIRVEGRLAAGVATTIASRNDTDIRLAVLADRINILVPPAGGQLAFVETIAVEQVERPAIDSATLVPPGRPVLTPDALMVKAFGPSAAELPEDVLRALYVERFLYETEVGTWLPRFFAEGSRATRLQFDIDRKAFTDWLGATARAIPDDVTIIWGLGQLPDNACNIFVRVTQPSPAFAGILDDAGQSAAISALTRSVLGGVARAPANATSVLLQAQPTAASRSNGCWAYSADNIASEHGLSHTGRRAIALMLDTLPVYDPGWTLEWFTPLEAEIDLHLDRLELVAYPDGLTPHVRAFAQVTQVRYHDGVKRGPDGRPVGEQPAYAATFEVIAAPVQVVEADPPDPAVPAGSPPSSDDLILQGIQNGGSEDDILSGLSGTPVVEAVMLAPSEEIDLDTFMMSFALSASGRLALVGGDNYFALWDLQERKLVRRLLESGGFTRHISWAPDGRSALVLHDDAIRWWDLTTGAVKSSFQPEGPPTFLTGDTFLIAMSGSIMELRATDGSPVRKVADGSSFWPSVPSGRLAVAKSTTVDIIEIATGTTLRRLPEVIASGWVEEVAISPDGTQAAIGTNTGAISLWDLGSGQRLAEMTGHTDAISGLAFRGTELVSTAGDGTMRFWRLSDGANVATAVQPNMASVGGPYVKAGSSMVYTTHYAIRGWDFTGQ